MSANFFKSHSFLPVVDKLPESSQAATDLRPHEHNCDEFTMTLFESGFDRADALCLAGHHLARSAL